MVSVKDGFGWFLSTGHVFGQYNAVWIEDRWYEVQVSHRWMNLSLNEHLILLKTVQKLPEKNFPFFRIAEEELKPGDSAVYVGFPANHYRVQPLRVSPYGGSLLHTIPHPTQGFSGGGVVKGGNLYGIIHGYHSLSLIGSSHSLPPILQRMKQDAPGVFSTNRPELKPKIVAPAPLPTIPEKAKPSWPPFPVPVEKKTPSTVPVPKNNSESEKNNKDSKSSSKPPLKNSPKKEPSSTTEMVPSPKDQTTNSTKSYSLLKAVREKVSNPTLWLNLATMAALGLTGGGTVFAGWKGIKYASTAMKLWKGAKAAKACFPFSEPMLPRDDTEIQQILSLRQQEQRSPLHDGFYGIALEDELRADPNQTIKDAFEKATARFNSVAPLSVQTTSSAPITKPPTTETMT